MCFEMFRRFFVGQGWFGGIFNFSSRKSSSMPRARSALIVVDVQNDFISGTLALSNCPAKEHGEEVLEPINKMLEEVDFDLIAYSIDWHPKDHISFINNISKHKLHASNQTSVDEVKVGEALTFDLNGEAMEQHLWPAHCVQETWGAELHKNLKFVSGSVIIKKGTNSQVDSYSAFFDNKRLSETPLQSILRKNGITKVFVCGLATDICVNFTATDSHLLGFQTYLVEDACRGVNGVDIHTACLKMKNEGIKIVQSGEVELLAS